MQNVIADHMRPDADHIGAAQRQPYHSSASRALVPIG
jgi:hypothetical protein